MGFLHLGFMDERASGERAVNTTKVYANVCDVRVCVCVHARVCTGMMGVCVYEERPQLSSEGPRPSKTPG